jgi:uncharacterized protein
MSTSRSSRLEPISLLVIQPTSLCNLNCRYCYVPDRRDKFIMSQEVLSAAVAKTLASTLVRGKIEFLFHAGEPLTAGIDFYRRVVLLIGEHNKRDIEVTKAIQTNATLVDDAWCDLFRDHDFHIGVSIDGPKFLHDNQRQNWSGRGSFDAVMRGLHKLAEYEIPFGAICVLTRESLAHADELFDFFLNEGFASVGFNIEEIESANRSSSLFSSDAGETCAIEAEFRAFAGRFIELWERHGRPFKVREFYDMALYMLRKQRDTAVRRIPDETCDTGIITVAKNGDLTPYSPEFTGSKRFIVGNILHDNLVDILTSRVYLEIKAEVHESIAMCATSCSYFDLCGGAFLSNKYWQNGTLLSTETITCRLTRQAIADLLLEEWAIASPRHAGVSL